MVEAIDGGTIVISVRTILVYSNTPSAPLLARSIRQAALEAGHEVVPLSGR